MTIIAQEAENPLFEGGAVSIVAWVLAAAIVGLYFVLSRTRKRARQKDEDRRRRERELRESDPDMRKDDP